MKRLKQHVNFIPVRCVFCFLMQNENQAHIDTNLPFIENLLFYAATLHDELLAIEPQGKLAGTWAHLKMNL